MIATVIHAEWRESRVSGEPFLAMKVDIDNNTYFFYMSPRHAAGWNSLMRQSYLPTWDYPHDDITFKPSDMIGKILSVSLDLRNYLDKRFWMVSLNIDWSKVPERFK